MSCVLLFLEKRLFLVSFYKIMRKFAVISAWWVFTHSCVKNNL